MATPTMHFYLYGDNKIDRFPPSFDFTASEKTPVDFPAFLLFDFDSENDSTAVICKIRSAHHATYGMTVSVTATREIQINLTALLNSVLPHDPLPPDHKDFGYTDGRQLIRIVYDRLVNLPPSKSQLIVNAILKKNPALADESYFQVPDDVPSTTVYASDDVRLQVSDAMYSAAMFFGGRDFISEITEETILDFDLNTLFDKKLFVTEDNKHCFSFKGKKLYLHKVHRLGLEKCLGVDLIYNFMEERRAVFVQYKCSRAGGRFYHRSDSNFVSELDRMKQIPGVAPCANFQEKSTSDLRLCRCPVFVKLCNKTNYKNRHRSTDSVYFPICAVDRLCERAKPASMTLRDRPHYTNEQFQDLVRSGLIGSTPLQSDAINKHLGDATGDDRLKLIFEEVREGKKGRG